MARKVQRKLDKWKSKEWYNIEAPAFIGRNDIGTTPADDPRNLIGRIVITTVGDLTGDFSKHNIKLHFEINDVTGNVASTRFMGHEITTDYLRSIVKRQTSRIDTNISVTTKDGSKMRIKPISFTVKRARTSQIKAIRNVMDEIVVKRASELGYEHFVEEVVTGKLAANIYRNSKSIYPIRRVEIRKSEVITQPIAAPVKTPTEAPTEEPIEASTETSTEV